MASSTIPALKIALLKQLQARPASPACSSATATRGPEPETEYIWLADVKGRQEAATIGTRARNETYTLTV
jgi:hypothetical protein